MNLERLEVNSKKENNVVLLEVAELEKPTQKLLEQLRDKIERGEYGLIIGEDASGRIPALILGGVIKRIHKLKDFREPNIIFIPGELDRHNTSTEDFRKYISKYGVEDGDKILVVTEVIQSGFRLNRLVEILRSAHYPCDIATISISHQNDDFFKERIKRHLDPVSVFSGGYSRDPVDKDDLYPDTPRIYTKRYMSGVVKKVGDSVSRPYISVFKGEKNVQKNINQSREDVGVVVDKLVDWYLSQGEEKKLKK